MTLAGSARLGRAVFVLARSTLVLALGAEAGLLVVGGADAARQPAGRSAQVTRWSGPIESFYYQLVARNNGGARVGPLVARLGWEECARPSGLPQPFALTQTLGWLAPGEEAAALWNTVLTCERYALTLGDAAPVPVRFDGPGASEGAGQRGFHVAGRPLIVGQPVPAAGLR